ncbi:PIR Superfamily Protein [Plasmodium ovale wallikeri]|uniref:PIR Superfamily Protein n=1 Tax=Plasmodium ovale wallikeri TaxID=864142 RepID=A0A1A9AIK5_PLAOA|nr:PIR Superfamily Protein [Plasmodium ovale wallikeri]SBT59013.1 PIR Superfamily Protein [Plasmodium ovale wallikeri]
MAPSAFRKEDIMRTFEQKYEIKEFTESYYLLEPLKNEDSSLYQIACFLEGSYNNSHLMHKIHTDVSYCEYLNEWLNNKMFTYTADGTKCDSLTLWEKYIEKLWLLLYKDSDREKWCARTPTTYECTPTSSSKTAISVFLTLLGVLIIIFFLLYKFSSFGSQFNIYVHKKVKILQNLLGISNTNSEENSNNRKIYIHYNSAEDYHST